MELLLSLLFSFFPLPLPSYETVMMKKKKFCFLYIGYFIIPHLCAKVRWGVPSGQVSGSSNETVDIGVVHTDEAYEYVLRYFLKKWTFQTFILYLFIYLQCIYFWGVAYNVYAPYFHPRYRPADPDHPLWNNGLRVPLVIYQPLLIIIL